MSLHEDISWPDLRRIVQKWAGSSADIAEIRPLEGGCVNTTLCLTLKDDTRVVIKIATHRVNRDFEREAHQLRLMNDAGLPVPRVYAVQTANLDDPNSYILMEYINGVDLAEAKHACNAEQFDSIQRDLARIVLRMHEHTSDSYGRVIDGAPTFGDWPTFYRSVYDPILAEARTSPHFPHRLRKQIEKLHEKLEVLLANDDKPRLAHWDLWSTNLLCNCDSAGNWRVAALLDPNCKYAHAEAEIAYLDLFHTITPAFMQAYQDERKLDDGYHNIRRFVYQLYPLIDHVTIYGNDYVKPLAERVEKALMLV